MDERSDDRLVEEHLAGSATAFAELVRRYERRAASLAYRMLGDAHDVEEVCQEAFLRAHAKMGELRQSGSFFPWFFSIVLNLCRERLRVRRRARAQVHSATGTDAGDGTEPLLRRIPDEGTPDAWCSLAKEELRRALAEALDALPEQYRQVIVLRCYEGLSYTEMARVLRCRKRTVRWRLYRARQMLRRRLGRFL